MNTCTDLSGTRWRWNASCNLFENCADLSKAPFASIVSHGVIAQITAMSVTVRAVLNGRAHQWHAWLLTSRTSGCLCSCACSCEVEHLGRNIGPQFEAPTRACFSQRPDLQLSQPQLRQAHTSSVVPHSEWQQSVSGSWDEGLQILEHFHWDGSLILTQTTSSLIRFKCRQVLILVLSSRSEIRDQRATLSNWQSQGLQCQIAKIQLSKTNQMIIL